MNTKRIVLGTALLFPLMSWASANRCGGDGPNPLALLPDANEATTVIPTQGAPQEFTIWDKRDEVVYRNESGEVWSRGLRSGIEQKLTDSPGPLAHLQDREQRFLITDLGGWVFDILRNNQWRPLSGPSFSPIFAGGGSIYGATKHENRWELDRLADGKRERICTSLTLPSSLKLATGQFYPSLNFYEVNAEFNGNTIRTDSVDIKSCTLTTTELVNPIVGSIQAVYVFESTGSVAVKTDQADMNLFYLTPEKGCRYFDVKGPVPFLPNPSLPILATQLPGAGISLVYLDEEKQGPILKSDPRVGKLHARDISLSDDGHQFFVRTGGIAALWKVEVK